MHEHLEGLSTWISPAEAISNTPISLVAPKRFFTARRMRIGVMAFAFEIDHRIHPYARACADRPARRPWSHVDDVTTAVPVVLACTIKAKVHSFSWVMDPGDPGRSGL